MRILYCTFFLLMMSCLSALSLTQEQTDRLNNLYRIVRCPVCDGQPLSGSNAAIAKDLRKIIKQKVENNLSDQHIKNDLVAIYGHEILFEPPKNASTFLLHYGIWLVLGVSFSVFIYRRLKQSPQS